MIVVAYIAFVLVVVSSIGILLALLPVFRFARRTEPSDPTHWPKVSVLRPVKGFDPAAREGFISFIEQDYPGQIETIFAVEGFDDPVLPLIKELQATHPHQDIKLVHSVARADVMGKVNNVLAAQAEASGEIYLSVDSDVLASPGDIKRLVRALLSSSARGARRIGAVGAMPVYRRMEDLGAGLMGAYYSPFMVLYYSVKDWIGPRDVFPATCYAILPEALAQAGGWESVADNIADDSTIGQNLYQQGFESIMSNVAVSVPEPTKSLRDWWTHQHRWQLTYRMTLPLGLYLLEPLGHPVLLALLLPLLFALAGLNAWVGVLTLVAYLIVRWVVIGVIDAVYLHEPTMKRWLWVEPLAELMLTGTWAHALLQTTTVWRGIPYRVSKGGKLVRMK